MNKSLDVYKAIATLEMSAMSDDKMTVEKAEELRQIIEKELEDKEKKDKVLEVIKIKLLAGCFTKDDNYSNYAMAIIMSGNETLKKNMMTEQEYNLVKEVLEK